MRHSHREIVPAGAPRPASCGISRLLLIPALVLLSFGSGVEAQKDAASGAGCDLHNGVYTCNLNAFRKELAGAQTVAIETQSNDRFTAAQLRQLIRQLGKQPATPDRPADLTFLLIPMDTPAIQFGPAGESLATLRVYAPGSARGHGALLWAETWTGQPDRPWPSIVHALIEQFEQRITQH